MEIESHPSRSSKELKLAWVAIVFLWQLPVHRSLHNNNTVAIDSTLVDYGTTPTQVRVQ